MLIKKFRLQSPDEDTSGTDVAEETSEELESADTGEPEQLEQESAEAGNDADESAEELVIDLDEQEQEAEGSEGHKGKNLPNELRRLLRQEQKEKKRIAEELERLKGGAPAAVQQPKKPKLEEFDYDADEFEKAMDKYVEAKSAYDREQDRQRAIQEQATKDWQAVQESYVKGKARFPKDKMQEAEEEVVSVLNGARQAMLLDVADDSTMLTFALGTNPETLRKIASVKSDAKFIKELTKIEMSIKSQPKKTAPPPERTVSGGGRTPGQSANKLESLKEEARKTGDYSAYFAEKARQGK